MRLRTDESKNPLRPVDWQYRRALELHESGETGLQGRVDPATHDWVVFLRRRAACGTAQDRVRLRGKMPRHVGATEIYEHPDGDLRAMVEARLLAGQPADEIARCIGVEPNVIGLYARTFFDVADRLAAPDFVFSTVLSAGAPGDDPNAARHALWRRVGYVGGVNALEQVMHGVAPGSDKVPLDRIARGAAASLEVAALLNAVNMTASASGADPKQVAQLQQIAARAAAAYPEEGSSEQDVYLEAMQTFLDNIPWTKFDHPPVDQADLESRSVPERLERLGFPMRAHERLLYERTGILPAQKLLEGARYPEKVHAEQREKAEAETK
jgi:hypothetical protein